ncbi:MAG: hypothetical protein P8Y37_09030 [Anaerolineales bacterium]
MELTEARTIVRTLAQGVDPITGEVFAADSAYNHPRVIRALFTVHDHTQSVRGKMGADEKRQRNVERGLPRNAGLPWTDFFANLDALRIQRAEHYPRATEYIPQMAELIRQGLVDPVATG